MNIVSVLINTIRQLRRDGLCATFRSLLHKSEVRWQEWRYGIYTEAVVDKVELGISNTDSKYYSPTAYSDFRKIMRALDVDPKEHVFFDYGAGMGRVMIMAATYPFRRVLGIELSSELATIGANNIAKSKRKLRCKTLELITGDAAFYQPPSDVTIYYFYNPFSGMILQSVLEQIYSTASLTAQATLVVCNAPANSIIEGQLLQQDWLQLKKTISLGGDRRCFIFRAKAAFGPVQD